MIYFTSTEELRYNKFLIYFTSTEELCFYKFMIYFTSTEELQRCVLECMTLILARTQINQWQMFQDVFNSICIFLSSSEPSKGTFLLEYSPLINTFLEMIF